MVMAPKPSGMRGFVLVWVGQLFSMVGSQMTHFAMGIWAWERTGQATPLALVGFFSFAPLIVFSPFAGVLVDRWNRKLVMALSDIGAGLVTIVILVLLLTDRLEIWHLYLTGIVGGTFGAFQWPAYSAAISLMVPKKHYARTSGMISMAESGVGIIAPILAGTLLPLVGFSGIFAIDLATLVIALVFLVLVLIPEPKRKRVDHTQGAFKRELIYGFRYLLDRPSLLYLQLMFFMGNLFSSVGFTLQTPMILASTGSNATLLASVQSAGAMGGLLGGLILTAWGGFKKKINGVIIGWVISGLLGFGMMGLGRAFPYWLAAQFIMLMVLPFINGSNQAIWQSKVAPEVQGRVFSVRRFIAQVTAPISMLVAGPLADQVFEPALTAPQTGLTRWLSSIFGTAPGGGMALIIFLCGVLVAVVGLVGYRIRAIREVETIIPDHDESS
jgi:MFS transporter, DHA3 family, macrolide efflux protein